MGGRARNLFVPVRFPIDTTDLDSCSSFSSRVTRGLVSVSVFPSRSRTHYDGPVLELWKGVGLYRIETSRSKRHVSSSVGVFGLNPSSVRRNCGCLCT